MLIEILEAEPDEDPTTRCVQYIVRRSYRVFYFSFEFTLLWLTLAQVYKTSDPLQLYFFLLQYAGFIGSLLLCHFSNNKAEALPLEASNTCKVCKISRTRTTHHCRVCDQCNDQMDHHCYFTGNCIGSRNYKYFISFLVYSITLSTSAFPLIYTRLGDYGFFQYILQLIILILLGCIFVQALGMLTFQFYILANDSTMINLSRYPEERNYSPLKFVCAFFRRQTQQEIQRAWQKRAPGYSILLLH